jgi:hypothetical protein
MRPKDAGIAVSVTQSAEENTDDIGGLRQVGNQRVYRHTSFIRFLETESKNLEIVLK